MRLVSSSGVSQNAEAASEWAGLLQWMVGTARFELTTSRTPSERATRLRYVPKLRILRLVLQPEFVKFDCFAGGPRLPVFGPSSTFRGARGVGGREISALHVLRG